MLKITYLKYSNQNEPNSKKHKKNKKFSNQELENIRKYQDKGKTNHKWEKRNYVLRYNKFYY